MSVSDVLYEEYGDDWDNTLSDVLRVSTVYDTSFIILLDTFKHDSLVSCVNYEVLSQLWEPWLSVDVTHDVVRLALDRNEPTGLADVLNRLDDCGVVSEEAVEHRTNQVIQQAWNAVGRDRCKKLLPESWTQHDDSTIDAMVEEARVVAGVQPEYEEPGRFYFYHFEVAEAAWREM